MSTPSQEVFETLTLRTLSPVLMQALCRLLMLEPKARMSQTFPGVCSGLLGWFFSPMLRRKEFCDFPPFALVLGIFGGVTGVSFYELSLFLFLREEISALSEL